MQEIQTNSDPSYPHSSSNDFSVQQYIFHASTTRTSYPFRSLLSLLIFHCLQGTTLHIETTIARSSHRVRSLFSSINLQFLLGSTFTVPVSTASKLQSFKSLFSSLRLQLLIGCTIHCTNIYYKNLSPIPKPLLFTHV